MITARPIDNENWGVPNIKDYPVWQFVVNKIESRLDLGVFDDRPNIKGIFTNFVADIQSKFNQAAEEIANEINNKISELKANQKNQDKLKVFENVQQQILNARTLSKTQELDHEDAMVYYAVNGNANQVRAKNNEDWMKKLQFQLILKASQAEFLGEEIKNKANAFINQLKEIWTSENIMTLCLHYVVHAARRYKDNKNGELNTVTQTLIDARPHKEKEKLAIKKQHKVEKLYEFLLEDFINPIMDYIQSLCATFGKEFNSVYGTHSFEDDVEKITYRFVHGAVKDEILQSQDVLAGTSLRIHQEERSAAILREEKAKVSQHETETRLAQHAVNVISTIEINNNAAKDDLANQISNNTYLRKALIAAYEYMHAKRESCWSWMRHSDDGKKATVLFVDQLINKLITNKDLSETSIQNEALMYLNSQGIYSQFWASGYHLTSRIKYILDAGILDNRVDEIVTKEFKDSVLGDQGLFSQKATYKQNDIDDLRAQLSHDARVDILEKVKGLRRRAN